MTNLAQDEVIELVRRHFDLEDIQFDENGLCSLSLDDTKLLLLTWDEELSRICLNAEVRTAQDADGTALLKAALSFNLVSAFRGGPVFSMDEDTSTLFLTWSVVPGSESSLQHDLDTFFDTYHQSCGQLASHAHLERLADESDPSYSDSLTPGLIKA